MIDGWVWIIIGVAAVVIILWVPSKIPELAKILGTPKGEFNQSSEMTKAANLAERPALVAAASGKAHQLD
jgi:Sec-independent protein translocase protein TatA